MIEFSEIVTGLGDWIPIPAQAVVSVLTIAAIAWICWRARSFQPIVRRIWRLVAGEPTLLDEEIQKGLQSEAQLQHFRVESGIPCRTLAQAKCVIAWSLAHDESLQDIAGVGRNFDLTNCELNAKRIDHWVVHSFAGLFLTAVLGMLALLLLMGQLDQALLRFKDTGVQFTMSIHSAQRVWHSKATLQAAECSKGEKKLAGATGFTETEVVQLCEFFKSEDVDTLVKNTVKEQKIFSMYYSPIFIFIAWLLGSYCLSNHAAGKMLTRQNMKKSNERGAVTEGSVDSQAGSSKSQTNNTDVHASP